MPHPALHFIGKDAAAPALTVRWCRKNWPERLPQGLVFCVPTSLALRRLRDALTEAYGAFQGVCFLMPSALTARFARASGMPAATPSEMLRVWDRVFDWLRDADPGNTVSECLFPGNRDWLNRRRARYAVAQRLMRLRAALAERCLDFGGVAAHPETALLDARERSRWAALDALEIRCREELGALGLEDPADRQLETLRNPEAQPQETGADWRLIVACVPDLMPALSALFTAAPACDILVQAAPSEAGRFTNLGLPDPAFWARADIALPDGALRSAETPADEAAAINAFLDGIGDVDPAGLCLGILDREIMPPLSATLAAHGVSVFEPEPLSLADRPPAQALLSLLALTQDDRTENLLPLLCVPEAPAVVNSNYATLRAAYDCLMENHRPGTLRAAARFAGEGPFRDFTVRCRAWAEAFRQNPVAGARTFLADLYGTRTVDPMRDPLLFSVFEALRDLLDELASLRTDNLPPAPELMAARLNELTLRPVRGGADCSYEGRLELLWSSAPVLLLAGLNEGIFPDTAFEDAFLPNGFRRRLGLRSDLTRAARDAYILETACAARAPDKVCLLCARSNVRGDWLRPSRLLFRCDAKERTRRAEMLFVEPAPRAAAPGAESGLAFPGNPLEWGKPPPPERLSSSAIRRFLASPLEYWLTDALGLRDTDDLSDGLSARAFGILLHAALRVLRNTAGNTPETLMPPLLAALDEAFARDYGNDPDVELLAARQAAERRLRAAARLEAELRAEGWETVFTEEETRRPEWQIPLEVNGRTVTLYGQIDRVDRNVRTGVWRIIDYKTGSAGKGPDETHWVRDRETGETAWTDFQLPIYRLITRKALGLAPDNPPELAYITLPAEGQAVLKPFFDPVGEAETVADLRAVTATLLTLGQAPLPAETGYGNPLLARLTAPTLSPGDSIPCD